MQAIYIILAVLAGVAGLVCTIIILIDAFQDAIWKGIVSFLCGLYFLYYAIAEFEHDNKWLVVLTSLGGSAISWGFLRLAGIGM